MTLVNTIFWILITILATTGAMVLTNRVLDTVDTCVEARHHG